MSSIMRDVFKPLLEHCKDDADKLTDLVLAMTPAQALVVSEQIAMHFGIVASTAIESCPECGTNEMLCGYKHRKQSGCTSTSADTDEE